MNICKYRTINVSNSEELMHCILMQISFCGDKKLGQCSFCTRGGEQYSKVGGKLCGVAVSYTVF